MGELHSGISCTPVGERTEPQIRGYVYLRVSGPVALLDWRYACNLSTHEIFRCLPYLSTSCIICTFVLLIKDILDIFLVWPYLVCDCDCYVACLGNKGNRNRNRNSNSNCDHRLPKCWLANCGPNLSFPPYPKSFIMLAINRHFRAIISCCWNFK